MNKLLYTLHRTVKLAYTTVIVVLFSAAVIAGCPEAYVGSSYPYADAVIRGMLEAAAMSTLLISGFALLADVYIHKHGDE